MVKSAPNCPYIEAHLKGGHQRPSAIVLTLSDTTSSSGAALGLANFWHKRNSKFDSCHYVVDESMTYQSIWDNQQACYSPKGAIAISLCARRTMEHLEWEGPGSRRDALERAAGLIAALCKAHKIRPRILSIKDYQKWSNFKTKRRGGIFITVEGVFSAPLLMALVEEHMKS